MTDVARPFRCWWKFARSAADKSKPKPAHKGFESLAGAEEFKRRLQRQYGDRIAACAGEAPLPAKPNRLPAKRKQPAVELVPVVHEQPHAKFWVSVLQRPQDGSPAVITHWGFVQRADAEACKDNLRRSADGNSAMCLTTKRPAGARIRR
jgi:hypothetical protein